MLYGMVKYLTNQYKNCRSILNTFTSNNLSVFYIDVQYLLMNSNATPTLRYLYCVFILRIDIFL